jgi:hypothetical protein
MAAKKRVESTEEEYVPIETVAELTQPERRVLRPAGCREYMRKRLAKEFAGIVTGFVKAAKGGSCQHLKLVTELLGPARKEKSRRKGAAQRFLEEIEREEKARKGTEWNGLGDENGSNGHPPPIAKEAM